MITFDQIEHLPTEKLVTIWQRWNPAKKRFEHNHIVTGIHKSKRPAPKSDEQQKSWAPARWRKEYGYLDENNNVIT